MAKVSESSNLDMYPDLNIYSDIHYLEDPFGIGSDYELDPILDEPEKIPCDLDKMCDAENSCIFDLVNNHDAINELKNLQVDSDGEIDLHNFDDTDRTDLLNIDETVNTNSLLNIDDTAKTDLLHLDDTNLVSFNIEKEADHDANQITFQFMDLNTVFQANVPLNNECDDIIKLNDKEDSHDEPYSLNILNENDLNTFLMDEDEIVLNVGGNSFKNIAKDDNDTKPETALSTEVSYIPFVFNDEIDKDTCFVNVADVTVKNVNNVNKTKPKAAKKVARKKKKTDKENPVNDSLEKINENKTNVNTDEDNVAEKKESQTKAKKAMKRKAKSTTVQETEITAQKINVNKTDSSISKDLPKEKVKGKGKKATKKEKKVLDTAKENIPGEEVKPKKRKRKATKVSESSNLYTYSDAYYLEDTPFEKGNNYDVDPVLDEPDKIPCDTEDYCMFGMDNNRIVNVEMRNVQVDNVKASDGKTDLLNLDDIAKTDSLLNIDDTAKTDLLHLDDTNLVSFNMEKETNHDASQLTFQFMDLNTVFQVNVPKNDNCGGIMKKNYKEGILHSQEEPYSLNILNENDLNTFLMDEDELKVLNVGGNSFKNIAKDSNDTKPETALSTEVSYIPLVFDDGIDKNTCLVNVADVTVKNVNNVNKTKPKTAKKVVRKKKKTDEENPVNDSLEKNNENKANLNTAVDNLAEKKESQTKAKKAMKRKAKSKTVQETEMTAQKIDVNKTDSLMSNDLPEKEVKGKRKKAVKKEKKVADTVKENIPGEEVKPKKSKRKVTKDDPANQLSENVTTTTEFECPTCGLKFDIKLKCIRHMKSHDSGPFYCKYCNKEFSKVNTRNTHEWRVHSKPEPFKCSQCGERFKTFLKRLRHLQSVHQDNTQYPCDYCDKSFAYAAYRMKHIRITHLNKREYKCEECPAAFARRGALDNHMACKHGVGEMKYECHVCKRRFFVQTALRWHLSHTHYRHVCNECGDKFSSQAALDEHGKMHDKSDLDISLGIDFSTLPLDDYGITDSSYLDLNQLEV